MKTLYRLLMAVCYFLFVLLAIVAVADLIHLRWEIIGAASWAFIFWWCAESLRKTA
jgi:hypothetical protein